MYTLKLKKLNENAKIPYRASNHAAGYDLFSCLDSNAITVPAGQIVKVPTGIALQIPKDYYGEIRPRSGLSLKGIIAINGTIDADYRGEISVVISNTSDKSFVIENYMRIAQIVFKKYEKPEIVVVDTLDESERGSNGYSSTGLY